MNDTPEKGSEQRKFAIPDYQQAQLEAAVARFEQDLTNIQTGNTSDLPATIPIEQNQEPYDGQHDFEDSSNVSKRHAITHERIALSIAYGGAAAIGAAYVTGEVYLIRRFGIDWQQKKLFLASANATILGAAGVLLTRKRKDRSSISNEKNFRRGCFVSLAAGIFGLGYSAYDRLSNREDTNNGSEAQRSSVIQIAEDVCVDRDDIKVILSDNRAHVFRDSSGCLTTERPSSLEKVDTSSFDTEIACKGAEIVDVKAGDTLSKIVDVRNQDTGIKNYADFLGAVAAMNKIDDPNLILPRWRLLILEGCKSIKGLETTVAAPAE